MPTYDESIRCPRCGKPGAARVEPDQVTGVFGPGGAAHHVEARQLTVECHDKQCAYYARKWYVLIDPLNQVLFHTHTIYEDPHARGN